MKEMLCEFGNGRGGSQNVADIICEWLLREGESGTVDKSDARFDEEHAPSSGRERGGRDIFETGEKEEDSCSSKPDAEVTEGEGKVL